MIKMDERLLEVNKNTEILSAYVAADSMEASLGKNQEKFRQLAKVIFDYNPEILLFTGSGASYCTLYTPFYYMRANSSMQVVHNYGPVIEFEKDQYLLDKLKERKVFAIIASYSGKTADTVSVSKFLGSFGTPRIALSKSADGPLAKTCEYVLDYGDKCLYTSAMANCLSLMAELLSLRGEAVAADRLRNALAEIPGKMRSVISKCEKIAMECLEKVKDEDFFYVVGDGALWALAYQLGYTNLTEYSRVHAACIRGCEWRHGALEILFRKPAMIHLIGNDATRDYSLATAAYCEKHGAKVVKFDVKDYFETLPELAPYALHIVTQLFFMYQSTERGINMDDYLQMHVTPYKPGETYF